MNDATNTQPFADEDQAGQVSTHSIEELKQARDRLDARIREEMANSKSSAIAEIKALIGRYDFTESEIVAAVFPKSKSKTKSTKSKTSTSSAAPKYANPADASETWTGKGRQPNWYKEAIASGTEADTMLI